MWSIKDSVRERIFEVLKLTCSSCVLERKKILSGEKQNPAHSIRGLVSKTRAHGFLEGATLSDAEFGYAHWSLLFSFCVRTTFFRQKLSRRDFFLHNRSTSSGVIPADLQKDNLSAPKDKQQNEVNFSLFLAPPRYISSIQMKTFCQRYSLSLTQKVTTCNWAVTDNLDLFIIFSKSHLLRQMRKMKTNDQQFNKLTGIPMLRKLGTISFCFVDISWNCGQNLPKGTLRKTCHFRFIYMCLLICFVQKYRLFLHTLFVMTRTTPAVSLHSIQLSLYFSVSSLEFTRRTQHQQMP